MTEIQSDLKKEYASKYVTYTDEHGNIWWLESNALKFIETELQKYKMRLIREGINNA